MATEVRERVAEPIVEETLDVIGKSVLRQDGLPKACGAPLFNTDLRFNNLLYGACLLSPIACGRIVRIDTSKAEALEGVRAVLTAKDLPAATHFGTSVPDQPVLCSDRIYSYADPIALVAAESPVIAKKALDLIEVEYEESTGVFDPIEALDPDAPIAYPNHPKTLKGNLLAHFKIRKGEPADVAFAKADVVVENVYRTQHVDHAFLEPESGIAVPNADGSITLYGPVQMPFVLRRAVAPALGLPMHQIRVVVMAVGGGFGGKEDVVCEVLIRAGILARKTGRPVMIEHSRVQSTVTRHKRSPVVIRHKLGATRDGKLVACKIEIFIDKGPFVLVGGTQPPPFGGSIGKLIVHATGPYEIPNVHVDAYNVLTNNPKTGAMRGLGVPQVHFAADSQTDEMAKALGMSPLRFRLLNALQLGSTTATGQVLNDSVGAVECLQHAAEAYGWGRRKPESSGPKRKGIGIGSSWYCTGAGSPTDAAGGNVYMAEDGTVNVAVAIVDYGQGSHTSLAQIVAEELGVRFEDVAVLQPDTNAMPEAGPTAGSRATFVPGNALLRACRQIKRELLDTAAGVLHVSPEHLAIKNRRVFVADAPEHWLPIGEVAMTAWRQGRSLSGQGWWAMPPKTFDPETGQGVPFQLYSFATQIVEVEVDTETGEVELQRIVAAHDVGRAINPASIEGQIEGGAIMGQGMALTEQIVVDQGIILNPNLTTYIIPTTLDSPDAITPIFVENPTELGPFGSKGIGESALCPTLPAIANAVADAIGARVFSLPITPEKVLRAIEEKAAPGT